MNQISPFVNNVMDVVSQVVKSGTQHVSQWAQHSIRWIQLIPQKMQQNQYAALAVIATTNALFFIAIRYIVNGLDKRLENQAKPLSKEQRIMKHILLNGCIMGGSIASINLLLSKLGKYSLNNSYLATIATAAIACRILLNQVEKYLAREEKLAVAEEAGEETDSSIQQVKSQQDPKKTIILEQVEEEPGSEASPEKKKASSPKSDKESSPKVVEKQSPKLEAQQKEGEASEEPSPTESKPLSHHEMLAIKKSLAHAAKEAHLKKQATLKAIVQSEEEIVSKDAEGDIVEEETAETMTDVVIEGQVKDEESVVKSKSGDLDPLSDLADDEESSIDGDEIFDPTQDELDPEERSEEQNPSGTTKIEEQTAEEPKADPTDVKDKQVVLVKTKGSTSPDPDFTKEWTPDELRQIAMSILHKTSLPPSIAVKPGKSGKDKDGELVTKGLFKSGLPFSFGWQKNKSKFTPPSWWKAFSPWWYRPNGKGKVNPLGQSVLALNTIGYPYLALLKNFVPAKKDAAQ